MEKKTTRCLTDEEIQRNLRRNVDNYFREVIHIAEMEPRAFREFLEVDHYHNAYRHHRDREHDSKVKLAIELRAVRKLDTDDDDVTQALKNYVEKYMAPRSGTQY